MAMRESAVEAALHRYVKKVGGLSFKLAPTVKGIPDRLVILPGGNIHLVELKTSGGRLSPAQLLWHDRAAQRGVTVTVLHSVEEVRAWLARIISHPDYPERTDPL